MTDLFETFRLGKLELQNRIVMAPMTRSRAIGSVPNALMRDYYAARAPAGLIVTEGVAPSPNALGYARIPGLFSDEHVRGWRAVTEAVHASGGKIVAQLMHVGRIAHGANLPPGARVVAPSAVRANGEIFTDAEGPRPHAEPAALSSSEVAETREEIVRAARNAVEAGFDGVELHGANGYLLEQFLNPHTNRRTDAYGGSADKRVRFVAEVARATADEIGADRVGVRVSPFNTFNDLPLYDEIGATYVELARQLRGLLYVHVVGSQNEGFPAVARAVRETFGGPIVLNGGLDRARAEAALAEGRAELFAFGRPFIANPDLVTRLRNGTELAPPDPRTFYTPGPEGYVMLG